MLQFSKRSGNLDSNEPDPRSNLKFRNFGFEVSVRPISKFPCPCLTPNSLPSNFLHRLGKSPYSFLNLFRAQSAKGKPDKPFAPSVWKEREAISQIQIALCSGGSHIGR